MFNLFKATQPVSSSFGKAILKVARYLSCFWGQPNTTTFFVSLINFFFFGGGGIKREMTETSRVYSVRSAFRL